MVWPLSNEKGRGYPVPTACNQSIIFSGKIQIYLCRYDTYSLLSSQGGGGGVGMSEESLVNILENHNSRSVLHYSMQNIRMNVFVLCPESNRSRSVHIIYSNKSWITMIIYRTRQTIIMSTLVVALLTPIAYVSFSHIFWPWKINFAPQSSCAPVFIQLNCSAVLWSLSRPFWPKPELEQSGGTSVSDPYLNPDPAKNLSPDSGDPWIRIQTLS